MGIFSFCCFGMGISEEDFMKDISWIQNLKLRAAMVKQVARRLQLSVVG